MKLLRRNFFCCCLTHKIERYSQDPYKVMVTVQRSSWMWAAVPVNDLNQERPCTKKKKKRTRVMMFYCVSDFHVYYNIWSFPKPIIYREERHFYYPSILNAEPKTLGSLHNLSKVIKPVSGESRIRPGCGYFQFFISMVLMPPVIYVKRWAVGLFSRYCRFPVVRWVSPRKEVGSLVPSSVM